ncbi:alpha/beta hydrolase [Pseudonocardia petroleophila]|uniref:Uncharacterized protein n=1 Tax=Pseudonocardia petroleophila TaxID=37331 RepID=A0A7G7MFZ7_9PSEU|nr:hypothetical protein [Pseudonocardia petroleophila]QNG51708.1 hypothetical protein H6H00_26975 [Pseudonocardia petroleophila]
MIRRAGALLAATVLLALAACGSADDPGSAPLPGYTLDLPDLEPLDTPAGPTQVLSGVLGSAGYLVEVPPEWNGDLVVWTHGYLGNSDALVVDAPYYGLRQRFVEQGYAWAASSYDRNGYDVASGVRSTRELADAFAGLAGTPTAPTRTYLAGISMGGHVAARSVEEYPDRYAGALPLCGALGDVAIFDYFLGVQLVTEALAGVRYYPPGPAFADTVLPRLHAALGLTPGDPAVTSPAAQQLRAAVVLGSGGARPGTDAAFGFWKDVLLELGVREPAGPVGGVAADPEVVATNVGADVQPGTPVDLNAAVRRVAPADPATRASTALTAVAPIAGRPAVPVLSLHALGDLYAPFSMEQVYATEVAASGRSADLVQRAIRNAGHCEFSDAEAGAAWDDLVTWVTDGLRPDGDDVLDAAAVADPAYGCRFSDPEAYRIAPEPSEADTRRLFDPCPT